MCYIDVYKDVCTPTYEGFVLICKNMSNMARSN